MEAKVRMLYAEDDELTRSNYTGILENEGFEVYGVEHGDQAWAAYLKDKWDILLLDMDMPGRDGNELIRLVREREQEQEEGWTYQVPIVILSAMDCCESLYLGADDFLSKAASVSELIARVKKAISRSARMKVGNQKNIFRLSPLTTFDKLRNVLIVNGKEHDLKNALGCMFLIFCLRVNEEMSSVEICNQLWRVHSSVKEDEMRSYISRLRNFLKLDPKVRLENGYGGLYTLIAEDVR